MRRGQNQVGVANRAHGAGQANHAYGTPGFGTASSVVGGAGSLAAHTPQPEFCRLFQDSRRIQGLSQVDLAFRLGTYPHVIDALEHGQLAALPPWPETIRIVAGYLAPLNIDPRPVLHMIAYEIAAVRTASQGYVQTASALPPEAEYTGPIAAAPASYAYPARPSPTYAPYAGEVNAPSSRRDLAGQFRRGVGAPVRHARAGLAAAGRALPAMGTLSGKIGKRLKRRSSRRALIGFGVPLLLIFAVLQSNVVAATSSVLPAPMARAFASAHEYLRVQFAPIREGLRWIEVEDPRSRRGDKLQTTRR